MDWRDRPSDLRAGSHSHEEEFGLSVDMEMILSGGLRPTKLGGTRDYTLDIITQGTVQFTSGKPTSVVEWSKADMPNPRVTCDPLCKQKCNSDQFDRLGQKVGLFIKLVTPSISEVKHEDGKFIVNKSSQHPQSEIKPSLPNPSRTYPRAPLPRPNLQPTVDPVTCRPIACQDRRIIERAFAYLQTKENIQNIEVPSPQPSVDRLSVTFAPEERCVFVDSSTCDSVFNPGSPPIFQEVSPSMEKVRFSRETTVTDGEDDEDYSASVNAIMQRRASTRRPSKRRGRRPSSPFSPDADSGQSLGRRRSSVFTLSSGDTAISMDEGMTQEQIYENLRLHKEVLSSVKQQPWGMRKKLRLVHQAKAFVKKHEGELQERLAQNKTTRDILARFNLLIIKVHLSSVLSVDSGPTICIKVHMSVCCQLILVQPPDHQGTHASRGQYLKRELANFVTLLIPWELRIKEIESHFGSVVASYFTFLRWLFWVNLVICVLLVAFVAIPEMLTADKNRDGMRKRMTPEEETKSTNLITLWNFEGVLKYSPIFYGYYTNKDDNKKGYRLPFAYFMTGLAVYVYSFVATLSKMVQNSRMSKLSEKDDECIFTWKLCCCRMVQNSRMSKLSEKDDECIFTWKLCCCRMVQNSRMSKLMAQNSRMSKLSEKDDECIFTLKLCCCRMAQNSRMSKLSEKDDECIFTWKLFTRWDYMIGNAETAHNRTASIILGFKEALLEEAEKRRNARSSWRVISLRVLVNLTVLLLLVASAYAVVMVVNRSTEPGNTWWSQNETTIVISIISFLFPLIFEVIGLLEYYHPRKQLRIQLARCERESRCQNFTGETSKSVVHTAIIARYKYLATRYHPSSTHIPTCIRTQASTYLARPHRADASHQSPFLSRWIRILQLVLLPLL
uniref:(California timema) hypothetical protein n=1 Tax=Timema californicum TaxID=61474 RepID=A0A7R9IV27_TIMCA|nr:unnamed protein product [Timema californicum]